MFRSKNFKKSSKHLLLLKLLFEQKLTLIDDFMYDFSLCPIRHVVSHNCICYILVMLMWLLQNHTH